MVELTDKLCELSLDGFNAKLELYYIGTRNVGYKFYYKEKVLFQGDDYKPAIMRNIDDLESCIDLLGFLTVQPGDTDDEYFSNYTPDQLEFANSYDAEQLKGLVSDFENNDEYSANAKKYFTKRYKI